MSRDDVEREAPFEVLAWHVDKQPPSIVSAYLLQYSGMVTEKRRQGDKKYEKARLQDVHRIFLGTTYFPDFEP